MNYYELYDKILRELPKDGALANPNGYNEVDLRYLISCGYLRSRDNKSGLGLVFLTDLGMKFISEGGFTEQARLKEVADIDARLQRENWKVTTKAAKSATTIAWLSLIVSIVAAGLGIASLL